MPNIPKDLQEHEATEYTFKCDRRLWLFWDKILPHVGYAEHGMTVSRLIEDAVDFACYCLEEYKDFPDDLAAYCFRSCLWDSMTGFRKLRDFTHEVFERIDEQLRNRRVQQLYLEFFVRSRAIDGSFVDDLGEGYWTQHDRSGEFPSLPAIEGLNGIPHPLCANVDLADLRESISCALIFGNQGSQKVTIGLSQATNIQLSNYLGRFQIAAEDALLVILDAIQKFIPLNSIYSNSFREDLLDRYLACKTFVLRWLDQLAIFDSLSLEGDEYARLLVERLAVVNKRLSSGQSLLDYMADDLTQSVKGKADSQSHDLSLFEQLGGKAML